MKIIALDLNNFLKDYWNVFDFVVVVASIVGLVFSIFNLSFAFIYVLRSARLLKLFELRHRNILDSFMFILIKRFISVTIVVLIVLYSFAILGMELFSGMLPGLSAIHINCLYKLLEQKTKLLSSFFLKIKLLDYDLRDCCQESEYASSFRTGQNGTENGYYYLNNFENIMISYGKSLIGLVCDGQLPYKILNHKFFIFIVTLFQLMVANDWQITMEGYVIMANSPWFRIYFMFFYLGRFLKTFMISFLHFFLIKLSSNSSDYDHDHNRHRVRFGGLSIQDTIQKQNG